MRSMLATALLTAALTAKADITYLQETYPGSSVPTGRGYVTTPISPSYTQVTPTQNGVVDTSRPGYVVGPTLGRDDPLRDPKYRTHYGLGLDD